ncbi:MAG TPA: hypothetical protein VFJ86_06090 [Usitatibacter sp.]|jgi:hypothetical protein|nr:hypothetical protein [Usitatibacter sp.]
MPTTANKSRNAKKQARLYHLDPQTIQKLDALAVLCGGHGAAVTYAIDATYQAAGAALKKMKVRPPR